jgi:hypothetical protein
MKTMAVYIEYFQNNNFIAVFGKKICDSPRGCGKKVAKAYLVKKAKRPLNFKGLLAWIRAIRNILWRRLADLNRRL